MARSLLVEVSLPVPDAQKKGAGRSALLMCHSPQPTHHPHLWLYRLVGFPIFFGSMEKHYFQQACA